MLHQPVHMRDQVTNRIELIMQEHKPTFIEQLEQVSISLILVVFFLFGVSICVDYIADPFRTNSFWTTASIREVEHQKQAL